MNVQQLVEHITLHPCYIRESLYKLAKKTNSNMQDCQRAISICRKNGIVYHPNKKENIINNTTIKSTLPKILLFDIETAPMKAFVWKRWKENISLDQTISEWYCLAWSAKWLYNNEVMGEVLTSKEAINEDDSRIMKKLWELVNECDILITHNGDNFDIPRINTRFILNGLPPYKPVYSIDTCKIAKRQFGFSSNKLDALAGYFGIEHKLDTSFDLWNRCVQGDAQALNYMLTYNKMDVKILEEVYLKLRPWIKGGPNTSVYSEDNRMVCCSCGSEDLEELIGQYYYTSAGKYSLYRCKHCGAISRGKKSLIKNIQLHKISK